MVYCSVVCGFFVTLSAVRPTDIVIISFYISSGFTDVQSVMRPYPVGTLKRETFFFVRCTIGPSMVKRANNAHRYGYKRDQTNSVI